MDLGRWEEAQEATGVFEDRPNHLRTLWGLNLFDNARNG